MQVRARLGGVSRWRLVAVAAVAMGLAGTYQFLWSSLREPLAGRLATGEPSLGIVFTAYVVAQTLSQFPAGWVRDRYGPRLPMLVAALLLTVGFAGVALLRSVPAVVAAYAVGGIGVGITYTVAVNTPVKWFVDRRGLATGAVTMTFGGASFLLVPVVRGRIDGAFEPTLLALAGFVGLTAVAGAVVLRDPPGRAGDDGIEGEAGRGDEDDGDHAIFDVDGGDGPADDLDEGETGTAVEAGDSDGNDDEDGGVSDVDDTATAVGRGIPVARRGVPWRGAVRTWQFWLLYLVVLANNLVGLMIIGKTITLAGRLGLAGGAATVAASLVAFGEAGGTLAGGFVGDRIGYRRVSALGMVAAGIALAGAILAGEAGAGLAFAGLVGAAAFFRTPVFSAFPALVGEYYGPRYSSENYALLYSAKLWGGLGAGVLASALVTVAGWSTVFLAGAAIFVLAGVGTALVRPVSQDPW
jgi:OFA family oxalate/formate antiporter-like MFS transporter